MRRPNFDQIIGFRNDYPDSVTIEFAHKIWPTTYLRKERTEGLEQLSALNGRNVVCFFDDRELVAALLGVTKDGEDLIFDGPRILTPSASAVLKAFAAGARANLKLLEAFDLNVYNLVNT